MQKDQYHEAYRKLNPEQKQAVDAIEGPVMVIAGPGTGKTQVLTLRIAHILKKTQAEPEHILALTFTESGVRAMRSRLVELIGSTAYRVHIHTFHSFANAVIQNNPDQFLRIIGATPLIDAERISILEQALEEASVQHLRPLGDPLYYLGYVGRAISTLKRENVSPDSLERLCEEEDRAFAKITDLYHTKGKYAGSMKGVYAALKKKLEKNRDLLAVYRLYEQSLREKKRYDFEDMIMEVIAELERNESLLLSIEERYQYVLADEHQDANRGQNRLLELITSFHDSPNLFIVGDEKQAIFRFQGATLDNFLYFKRKHPDAVLIPLTSNYRSTQSILDAAHALIGRAPDSETLRVPLVASHPERKSPRGEPDLMVGVFQSSVLEEAYVAKSIRASIDRGVQPEEIAILYRKNRDAESLNAALGREQVPSIVLTDEDVLKEPTVRATRAILAYLASFGNEVRLRDVLHAHAFNFDPLDVYRLFTYAGSTRTQLATVFGSHSMLQQAGIAKPRDFLDAHAQLVLWHALSKKETVPFLIETIFRESALLPEALTNSRREDILGCVRGFLTAAENWMIRTEEHSLDQFLEWLRLHEENHITIRKEGYLEKRNAVQLMTAHRSKGLEFDEVYIPGLVDGHWGNARDSMHFHIPSILGQEQDLNDERRLLYVALTRGKRKVVMTYGKEKAGKQTLPSAFVEEIDPSLYQTIATASFESSFPLEDTFRPSRVTRDQHEEQRFIQGLFLEQGLSVTALNNYLTCPWQYVYRNLLRVPEVKEVSMLYGTAVHETLRYAVDTIRAGRGCTESSFVKKFEHELEKMPLTKRQFEDMLRKGKKVLPGYLAAHKASWKQPGATELALSGPIALSAGHEIQLRGKLDRVDHLSEDAMRVVDYKTGRPKSRRDIEGKTKSGSGDYFRQLVFYKLLLHLSDNSRRMSEGVIEFVEPDEKGRYHQESFEVEDAAVEDLRHVIEDVGRNIMDITFWDSTCGKKECFYCASRQYLTG